MSMRTAAPGRAPRPAPRSPQLQVVPRAQGVRANRFLVLVAGLLVSGLIGLLLLNLSMQKGAFELVRIQQQTEDLRTQEQSLSFDMQWLSSSRHLSRRAESLGMVRNPNPVFLDLSDGTIIGDPVPAEPAAVMPDPRSQTPVVEDAGNRDDPRGQTGAVPSPGRTGGDGRTGRR